MPIPLTNVNLPTAKSPVIIMEKSGDRKIGKGICSATHVSQHSCPTTCPLFNQGCYAEQGQQGIHSRRLNANDITDPLEISRIEAEGIKTLSGKLDLRLHIVGDCITDEGAELLAEAAEQHIAKHGKRVWTYTHGITKRKSWGKISVLRSVQNLEEIEQASADGYASALLVPEFKEDKPYDLGNGFVGVPCLHQTGKAPDCVTCGLCTKDELLHKKNRVILFSAHGSMKNTIKQNLTVINE